VALAEDVAGVAELVAGAAGDVACGPDAWDSVAGFASGALDLHPNPKPRTRRKSRVKLRWCELGPRSLRQRRTGDRVTIVISSPGGDCDRGLGGLDAAGSSADRERF
jgi:hypothetical protein